MNIRLLGPLTVANENGTVALPSKKGRALLGYLALREGAEIARNLLTGLLWGERSESQARASLRQTLSDLKGALGETASRSIAASKESVTLVAGSSWIDTSVLSSAMASADAGALKDAAALVGGELMEGLAIGEPAFEDWLRSERERFRLLSVRLHGRLMEGAEQSGASGEAIDHGLRLLSLDPLQEQVHRALMRLYAAQGRHDAALAQYERCRSELAVQLQVQPQSETEELVREIKAARRARLPEEKPPIPHGGPPRRLALPNRPSIAVLPFVAVGADADGGYFAEGVADDIITELSRDKDLFVVARHSSFRIAEQESDPTAIGAALGVRHLLTGSVRRSGERLRLSLHLIECESGGEAWAERYDRKLEEIFDVQVEVARTVAATIAGRITAIAGAAVAAKAPENLEAYDHVLRAQQHLQRYSREDYAQARQHLEAAIRAEPTYARPYGLLCLVGVYEWFWEMSEGGFDGILEVGAKALALDDRDAKTHLALAVAHLFSWNHDRAVHHIERAAALNPNDDLVAAEHGRLLMYLDKPDEGLLRIREAIRLNPYHPNWYWNLEGRCLHTSGRYEEAISAFERIDVPQFWVEAYLSACHAMCGRDELASRHRERLLAMHPGFRLSAFGRILPYRNSATRDRFLQTFRRAGIEG